MGDLSSPKVLWLKAALFLALALLAAAGLLLQSPTLRTAVLVAVLAWATARLYYFFFYVIHTYVDPHSKYSGLGSLLRAFLWPPRGRE